jgi:hypothetical protein
MKPQLHLIFILLISETIKRERDLISKGRRCSADAWVPLDWFRLITVAQNIHVGKSAVWRGMNSCKSNWGMTRKAIVLYIVIIY